MAEMNAEKTTREFRIRHRGRVSQVAIYLGKLLRFFINESDWKVLPMSAVIAALVGMVVKRRFFVDMEGSVIGAFALVCMCIWNGCFNSIQSICRERAIIKREHRSGMHITSYIAAHMIYQFLICAAQTVLSIYVIKLVGVKLPTEGFITRYMSIDLGISMFLVSYASDMLSLLISGISRTPTGAMTLMPFVLIFQLVFSGGIIPLPNWSQSLSNFTISNYGIKVVAAQSGYNELPMSTAWKTLYSMRNNEIGGSFTLGQLIDLMDNPGIEKYRDMEVLRSYTVGEMAEIISSADAFVELRDREVAHPIAVSDLFRLIQTNDAFSELRSRVIIGSFFGSQEVTVGSIIDLLLASDGSLHILDRQIGTTITLGEVLDFLESDPIGQNTGDTVLNKPITVGKIADFLKNNEALEEHRDRTFTLKMKVGDILDVFGEDNVKELVQRKTAEASQNPEYACTVENVLNNWLTLALFALAFAALTTLVLEFIDKDKR